MKKSAKLFAALLVAALVAAPAMLPKQARALGNHYSDKQIFEGVVLGHGPVAAAIPDIGGGHAWSTAHQDAQTLEDVLVARDPLFLKHFAADMRSGDPGRVTHAFENARKLALGMHYSSGQVKNAAVGAVMVAENAGGCLIETCAVVLDNYGVAAVVEPLMAVNGFSLEHLARAIASRLNSESS